MDCQTELRISTVTYFSTSRAPQSSGPFLPFPLPFLPMTRLRGPRWTVTRPPREAKRKSVVPGAFSAFSEGGDPMDTINQISTTDRTPLHTSFCCRSSTEDCTGWSRETHGTHGLGTDAHGSHRRTSQAHNHPATHECRDATELGVAARDGVEASGSRRISPRSRDHVVPPVRYSTVHVPVQYVPSPPGVFLPVPERYILPEQYIPPVSFYRLPPVSFYGSVSGVPAPPGVFLPVSLNRVPVPGSELLHVAPLDEIHVQQHHSVGWRSYGGGARD